MSLKFKDSTRTIHSMGGGGGVSASQLEALYPLLAKLYIDQEGDLIFGSHKVTISDELSTNDQFIEDMFNNPTDPDPDRPKDENDEAIEDMFKDDDTDPDNNEFDDLFNDDTPSGDDEPNEFDDLFNSSDDSGNTEDNEFDDMFNDNSESDIDDEINSWFNGDDSGEGGEGSGDSNEFDDLFNGDGSDSGDSESNEFDDLFNS